MEKQIVTVDGNGACAHVAYEFTEVAAIYPITPSSPMAAKTDEWSAKGKLNMFGMPVKLVEMQSEAGAIGAVHGALQTGSLATTYSSSQGLMLMIPTLYRITGEHLPAVLHIAARTVGTHANSSRSPYYVKLSRIRVAVQGYACLVDRERAVTRLGNVNLPFKV